MFIQNELMNAARVLGKRRVLDIVRKSAVDAMKEVGKSKLKALVGFTFSAVRTTAKIVNTYRKEGIKGVGKLILNGAKERIESFKSFASDLVRDFKTDKRGFTRKVAHVAIFSTAALAYAGGFDLEGGAPDADLKFGIGHHRNIFTHTILLPLFLEFSIRFILNIAEEMVKEGHGGIWKKLYDFKKEYSDTLIGGMWFGAMLHLMKDSAPFSDRTKPLSEIHGLSMESHKRILSASSVLSGIFAHEAVKKKSSGGR